jgi:hypothetical protein
VDDFVEVLLGSDNLFSGQSGEAPISLDLSSPVTNLDFTITLLPDRLANLALLPAAPPIGNATIQQISPGAFRVSLRATAGQSLSANASLSAIDFDALAAAPSGVVPLHVSDIVANRTDGVAITRTLAQDGRIVVVQSQPVLELIEKSGQVQITLFAPPGTYVIESTPSLSAPVQWTQQWQGSITASAQLLTFPITQNNIFYRARTP